MDTNSQKTCSNKGSADERNKENIKRYGDKLDWKHKKGLLWTKVSDYRSLELVNKKLLKNKQVKDRVTSL